MHHVGPALFFAQLIIGCACIDEHDVLVFQGISERQQRWSRSVDNDEFLTRCDLGGHIGNEPVRLGVFDDLKGVFLI